MRARLLDLGDVSAVRAQSVYHAVAAAMRPDDDPALILVRPTSAGVSLGGFRRPEVDVALCRERGLPVIRRHDGGEAVVIDDNQLCCQLALPRARLFELAPAPDLIGRLERLTRAPITAYRDLGIPAAFRPSAAAFRPSAVIEVGGRKLGDVGLVEIGEGICFVTSMVFDFDPELVATVFRRTTVEIEETLTSIRRQLPDDPPGLAAMAEALVSASESCYGLELIPSMPTPEEMDAILEWDGRLLWDGSPPQTLRKSA